MRMQAAVLLAALAFSADAAQAQSVEEFYKGRNVSMMIGFSAGSGYDIYARLLARYMGRYIPGRPNIVAQNMPGAGVLRNMSQASRRRTAACSAPCRAACRSSP